MEALNIILFLALVAGTVTGMNLQAQDSNNEVSIAELENGQAFKDFTENL